MAKGFKNFLKSEASRLQKVTNAVNNIEKTDRCIIMADYQNAHSFIKFDNIHTVNAYFSRISSNIDKVSAIEGLDPMIEKNNLFYPVEYVLNLLKNKPVAKMSDVTSVKNLEDAMNFLNTYAVRGFRG